MDQPTVDALRASILRWEARAVSRYHTPSSVVTCPLCQIYYTGNRDTNCDGCPVMKSTGRRCCGGTPVNEYDYSNTIEEARHHAAREVEFLKSLLPEEYR